MASLDGVHKGRKNGDKSTCFQNYSEWFIVHIVQSKEENTSNAPQMLLKSGNETTKTTPALKVSTSTYPNTGWVDRVHTEEVVVASVHQGPRALWSRLWLFYREEMTQG